MWFEYALLHLLHHLDAEHAERLADISDVPHGDLLQEGGELLEGVICGVVYPGPYEHPVVRLQLEILRHVVHYQRPRDVPPQPGQVLDEKVPPRGQRMLPVEPIGDVALRVQLVKDPIGIVLHGCRENHYFEMLRHISQEGLGARPDQELPIEVPTGAVARVVV